MYKNVEQLLDAKATLGESPVWDTASQLLYWVDIRKSELHRFEPTNNVDSCYHVGQHVGAVTVRTSGGIVLALKDGFAAYDPDNKKASWLQKVDAHLPNHLFNDGKCDPAGRFLAGTTTYAESDPAGNLYCLERDLQVRNLLSGITVSNGMAWSLDHKTFYFIDSPTYSVTAFEYDVANGSLANPRTIIQVPRQVGIPDGMTIDAEGMLWIAHWGGGRVCRWHPERGDLLQTIHIPALQTTSCTFGGVNLDMLFVTSARLNLSPRQLQQEPYAGGLFAVRPNCCGVEAFQFAG